MIVKIQKSITTNSEHPQMLIYDKSRKYTYQDDLSKDVEDLLKGRLKAYFKAELVNSQIVILNEVKTQNW